MNKSILQLLEDGHNPIFAKDTGIVSRVCAKSGSNIVWNYRTYLRISQVCNSTSSYSQIRQNIMPISEIWIYVRTLKLELESPCGNF